MTEPLDLIAACAFGLEAVVVRELEGLGHDAKPISTGRVLFRGDAAAVARANIHLRTADRVLIRIGHFPAPDFEALFEGVKSLPWERWITPDMTFPVAGRSVKSQLSSVPACQRAAKRAIVDRLLAAHRVATLPETGPRAQVEIALLDNTASLTIDTSGDGLHKRGYRPLVGEAALKETLAAGLVLLSGWRPQRPLVDPFCGTGTIAIEAAMIARGIAPGVHRSFDAESWPALSADVWRDAREAAQAAATGRLSYAVHASDIDERALSLARRHAAAAGVERDIHFKRQPFEALSSKAEYGVIITNPPYGVRLGDEAEVERLYRTFPMVLRGLPTWSFHILTARQDLETLVGQRATRRRKLFNAQIECTYFTFFGPRPPRDGESTPPAADTLAPSAEEGDAPTPEPTAPVTGASPAFGGLRERDLREIRDFEACLSKNTRHLRKWPARGITCYRLYDREQVDVPLIIDRYEEWIHASEYEREHSRTLAQQADWYDAVRAAIARACDTPPDRIIIKEKRRQRGLSQHEKHAEERRTMIAREGGLRFEVNLTEYTDVGLFLDHRQTRAMVREGAAGARFLNLFCYTGSFTVYAAAGGAAGTTSVDLSNTYLDWAQRNLSLNGFWPGTHRLIKSDVIEFLAAHPRGPHYDLVVVDPPTFSNSSSTEEDWEVAQGHTALFERLFPLLAPGATVYFSNNYRRFKLDEDVFARHNARVIEITKRTIPPDYRDQRIHRCWRITAP